MWRAHEVLSDRGFIQELVGVVHAFGFWDYTMAIEPLCGVTDD